MREIWDDIYSEDVPPAFDRLRGVKGVALGFHSVIDGIKRVDPAEIEAVLRRDPALCRAVAEGLNHPPPVEIGSPADALVGLLHSLRAGRTFRMVIHTETAFRWILETFGCDG